MIHSAAVSSSVHDAAARHLIRADGQEDLCFALWYPSEGLGRKNGLLHSLLLPEEGDRKVHGNASFEPQYVERAVRAARAAGAGLAFLHSHPAPGWQDMSGDDIRAEERLAATAFGATELPLLGMTIGTDGAWSARFWTRAGPRAYTRHWCSSTRIVGQRLAVTFHDKLMPAPQFQPELTRTVSAWGPRHQAQLARLRVGIIGTGSVGSIVAESLARMGISTIRLLDFDAIETINLDRLLHATRRDILCAKVRVLARALRRSATAERFDVDPLEYSIVEEQGFRAALDCDVLFSCVDRPWPRSVLNFIAYAHLVPVIDGGIAIRTLQGNTGLRSADIRAHVATPGRRCMECLGQYDPALVSHEREGYLDNPTYIAGLPEDHPLRRNENVFPFSVLTSGLEMMQLLSMVVAPFGRTNPGAHFYHFVPPILDVERSVCKATCLFPNFEAKGDRAGITLTGRHAAAERARAQRSGVGWLLARARHWFGFGRTCRSGPKNR